MRESPLRSSRKWVAEPGQRTIRTGEGEYVVMDGVIFPTPLHGEPFLTLLGVFGERAVSETVAFDAFVLFLDLVDDAADVQRLSEKGVLDGNSLL